MSTPFTGFESLRVYRLAEELCDTIWDIVNKWQNLARDTVGKQLIRALDSICANIAEGSGGGTYKDNCRFIDIARGSLYEPPLATSCLPTQATAQSKGRDNSRPPR